MSGPFPDPWTPGHYARDVWSGPGAHFETPLRFWSEVQALPLTNVDVIVLVQSTNDPLWVGPFGEVEEDRDLWSVGLGVRKSRGSSSPLARFVFCKLRTTS